MREDNGTPDDKAQESGNSLSSLGLWAMLYLVALGFAIWGFSVGRFEVFPFSYIEPYEKNLREFIRGDIQSKQTPLKDKLLLHLQERRKTHDIYTGDPRYAGFIGEFRRFDDFVDPGFILISRYSREAGQAIVDLVRLSDFKTLHTWVPSFDEFSALGQKMGIALPNEDNFHPQSPLLNKDGSIVFFNHEGYGMTKLDRCNKFVWMNPGLFHHSLRKMPNGNFIAPTIVNPRKIAPSDNYRDDGFTIVSPEGKTLGQYSVGKILMDNGYRSVFLDGPEQNDRVHLNDAHPVLKDAGITKAGDIALSARHLSAIILYRPSTNKVIALRKYPWLNQHDVSPLPNGSFSIFGNDVYRGQRKPGFRFEYSEVYIWDPANDIVTTPYTEALKKVMMGAETAGLVTIMTNGDAVIEETDKDRILRVSKDSVRWIYINKVADGVTGALFWSKYYEPSEINLSWMNNKCG